ncbi:MAG: heavy metal-binding domain-containing protein, partial [Chthoniobacterales bacterium]
MTKRLPILVCAMSLGASVIFATPPLQFTCLMHPDVVMDHPGHCPKCGMKLVPVTKRKRSTLNAQRSTPNHQSHSMHEHGMSSMQMSMQSSANVADPMSRAGSGTSWLPDSTPVYGRMLMLGEDMLMLHGAIFPRYTNVSTQRGDDRIDAPNWLMGMYSHSLGDDVQFGARLMMSLDPLTEQGRGYPLLFQSGESWNDQPLRDRQHPHD